MLRTSSCWWWKWRLLLHRRWELGLVELLDTRLSMYRATEQHQLSMFKIWDWALAQRLLEFDFISWLQSCEHHSQQQQDSSQHKIVNVNLVSCKWPRWHHSLISSIWGTYTTVEMATIDHRNELTPIAGFLLCSPEDDRHHKDHTVKWIKEKASQRDGPFTRQQVGPLMK